VSARQHLCPRRLLLGASLPGSNAEYVAVPATSIEQLPDQLDLLTAAMAEPAACAVHAVALSRIGPADTALVIGAGPIGLFLVQTLRAHGVEQVLVAERNQQRRDLAADSGATVVADEPDELVEEVRLRTGGAGVQASFDAVGMEVTRRSCVASTAPGGRAMFIGLHSDETSMPINALIRNEVSIQGVFAYTPASFRTALAHLACGRIGLKSGVVESELADGAQWYERLVAGDPAAKVMLRPTTGVDD
jgi:threonine dehydrogenase-like Zn-dependent dehydrogenase